MGTDNNSADPNRRRTWANMGAFYEITGPPKVSVSEDKGFMFVQASPFGQCGLQMEMPISRWREMVDAGDRAIAAYVATKLPAATL